MAYQIFTDATADLSEDLLSGCPPVGVVPMDVEVGEASYTYTYGPGGNLTTPDFYTMQRAGQFAVTSQINPETYRAAFEPALREGRDVVYLSFSSGMSGTIQGARLCAEELREAYPERTVLCLDTLCASAGEGFLVREAALRQKEGLDAQALAAWVETRRLQVCHWFTVDTFTHLRHGGRVSAASAAVGSMLQIKPLLHVDESGALKVAGKPRGRAGAIQAKLKRMEEGWRPDLGKLVVVAHGDCPEDADRLRQKIAERFPEAEIWTTEIGPVIGAHTGPGMLAVLYWGDNR